MMVEEETYRTCQFSTHGRNVGVLQVHRANNGAWFILTVVEIEVKLPDGRTVISQEQVLLNGKEERKKRRKPVRPNRERTARKSESKS